MSIRNPFFLQHGSYRGKAVEVVLFTSLRGYDHLRELKRTATHPGLKARLDEVFKRAERPAIRQKCVCGQGTPRFIAYKRDESGVAFFELHCEKCKDERYFDADVMELSFSSVGRFGYATDKKAFLRHLRWACGLPQDGKGIKPYQAPQALGAVLL